MGSFPALEFCSQDQTSSQDKESGYYQNSRADFLPALVQAWPAATQLLPCRLVLSLGQVPLPQSTFLYCSVQGAVSLQWVFNSSLCKFVTPRVTHLREGMVTSPLKVTMFIG